MSNQNYQQNFFIVPSHIASMDDMTLIFLRVYETIFQFWNKNLPCFLSNAAIQERANAKHSQVNAALIYFEKHKKLERKFINGKRYLTQPMLIIETDCEIPCPTGGAVGGYRQSGSYPTGGAVHNIKNVNKEVECVGASATHSQISTLKKEEAESKALENTGAIELFNTKFAGRDVTLEQLFQSCQEHYEQKRLWATKDKFLKWIKNENPENYEKIDTHSGKIKSCPFNPQELELFSEYKQALSTNQIEVFYPNLDKRQLAKDIYERISNANQGTVPETDLQRSHQARG